ncbi:MAG TPA: hypothetical protein VL156_12700 [Terriglobales bacterium]|jgi:hypothetical protein|nr:hypothetical protein [Terriglobales bacterium]
MQNKRNVATWLGAVLGVLAALVLNATFAHAAESNWVTEEFHQTYSLTSDGRVSLNNINGAAHISAWDRNEVKVDAVKRADDQDGLKDIEIRVNPRPDSISISTEYRPQEDSYSDHHYSSVEYRITVPRNARLDDIQLINGALDITGVLGEVRAECINGKLMANGLTNRAKLSTVNGILEVRFDRMPAESIDLGSVNGRVELTLPSDAKASLEATTVHGQISNQFGLHSSNHMIGHDLHGSLGGGGTHIRLSNVNGAIEVLHANDGRAMSPAKSEGNDGDEI